MDDRPDRDYGPDPHLNERGVRLTREQRRRLAVIAVLIGTGLLLALAGILYGLPPQWRTTPTPAGQPTVVVGGTGSALVTVLQDGLRTERGRVVLPHTVPTGRGVQVVTVSAAPLGAGSDATGCSVQGGPSRSLDQRRTAAGLLCDAVLR